MGRFMNENNSIKGDISTPHKTSSYIHSYMRFDRRSPAAVPSRQVGPAMTAVMIDVFGTFDHVRNTA